MPRLTVVGVLRIRLRRPLPLEAVKELRFAGENACATKTSPVLALVGQTVSSALPACGHFFHSFLGSGGFNGNGGIRWVLKNVGLSRFFRRWPPSHPLPPHP